MWRREEKHGKCDYDHSLSLDLSSLNSPWFLSILPLCNSCFFFILVFVCNTHLWYFAQTWITFNTEFLGKLFYQFLWLFLDFIAFCVTGTLQLTRIRKQQNMEHGRGKVGYRRQHSYLDSALSVAKLERNTSWFFKNFKEGLSNDASRIAGGKNINQIDFIYRYWFDK